MNDLIKLAAASLIGMSGLAVSATTVAQKWPMPPNNPNTNCFDDVKAV